MPARQDWETLKQELQAANALIDCQPAFRFDRDRGRNYSRDRPRRFRTGGSPEPSRWVRLLNEFDRYHRNHRESYEFAKLGCPFPNRSVLRDLAYFCGERTRLMDEERAELFRPLLLAVSAHRKSWVRPLDDWAPETDEPDEQSRSLVRHLFALHDVPGFLDAVWRKGLTPESVIQQNWYKHIGSGKSIRTAKLLPQPLTRGMAHHFLNAPDGLDPGLAIHYARARDLGADDRVALSLAQFRLETGEFWDSVLRWLGEHPSLTHDQRAEVLRYVHHQKFVPSTLNPHSRRRGLPRETLLVPAQPHLQMKGRTVAVLLREAERWRRSLAFHAPIRTDWPPSEIAPLVYVVGCGADRKRYETVELICLAELQDEGHAMRHCVADYWRNCQGGFFSIWSLTVEDAAGEVRRLLTLQVTQGGASIIQAQGVANRLPTDEEIFIIERWAQSGGPRFSPSACT